MTRAFRWMVGTFTATAVITACAAVITAIAVERYGATRDQQMRHDLADATGEWA